MNNGHRSLDRRLDTRRRICAGLLFLLLASALGACTSAKAKVSTDDRVLGGYLKLEQGWTDETRQQFWFAPQGSVMLRYEWFLALEARTSTQRIASRENLEKHNFIAAPPSKINPDSLPIGFSRERYEGKAFVGLTCAACHTAQLRLGDAQVIIEGAPATANVNAFVRELIDGLEATLKDGSKFERFAARVLGDDRSEGPRSNLKLEMAKRIAEAGDRAIEAATAHKGRALPKVVYGNGRVDAFGGILNSISIGLKPGINGAMPDAPVSFPFLWDAPAADSVQWNGGLLNAPVLGGLSRNIGEVLGVFGRYRLEATGDRNTGYANSVDLESLGRIENWLKDLTSPRWPEEYLPSIDQRLAAKGKKIYGKMCMECHALIDSRDPARSFKSHMTPVDTVGTDPTMLVNLLLRRAETGPMKGRRAMVVTGDPLQGETRAIDTLVHAVSGVMLADPIATMRVGLADRASTEKLRNRPASGERPPTTDAEAVAALRRLLTQEKLFALDSVSYRARPLNGIWATAPYLHNGSVPSLHDLLTPAAERPSQFSVGGRELDPVKVGLRSEAGSGGVLIDCQLPGNANTGHEYGTRLGPSEKSALLEYLKTL